MKFKTISSNKTVSIPAQLRVLSETDGLKQKVELWLLNGETNRNDWRYENLEEHRKLFADTPILVAYVGDKIGDGHNFETVRRPDGTEVASFMGETAERIVGYFKSSDDIRIEERDNKKWIVGVGYLWSWYAIELVDKLKKQGLDGMSVSIETLVTEMYRDGTTEVYTKYVILGTTILGDDVRPAVADANIRALSQLGGNEVRQLTLRVASQYDPSQSANNKSKQGETKTMLKIKDLDGKFAGYKPLAVNGNGVALLATNSNELFYATATKENGEVIEGAKTAVNATVTLGEGDNAVTVALDAIMAESDKQVRSLQADLEQKTEENATLSKALKAMQDQETARRKEAVINAVKNRLAENRAANPDADIAENACDDLLTDEKVDEFVNRVDKDGHFIGDKEVMKEVDSRCMTAINKAASQRANSAQNAFNWKSVLNAETGSDSDADELNHAIANVME